MKNQKDEHKVVLINTWTLTRKVFEDDIVYVKCDGLGPIVCISQNKNFISRDSLFKLGQILDNRKFFRVHRNCIINLNYVDSYSESKLLLVLIYNGEPVTFNISRRRIKPFKDAIIDFYKIVTPGGRTN